MQNHVARADQDTFPLAALPLVLLGSFMVVLDFFIVNVAIPPLQSDLGASAAAVQFVIAGYGVAYGSGLILSARLGDRFGRRRMYLIGFGLFTAASAACGIAPSPTTLIVARLAQGFGASLLSPQVLALIGDLYHAPARRGRAFTGYGLSMGLAAVLGQLVGGLLIQADIAGLGWRSCFLVNIPVGLIALPLTLRIIPESRGDSRRLDVAGSVTVTAAVVALVLPLIAGRELGWPTWSIVLLIAFVPLMAGFIVHQHIRGRAGEPLVDLTLFRQRGIGVGIAGVLAFYTGMASFFLVFALYLQDSLHLTPLESGLLFVAIGAGFFATSLVSGRIHRALGELSLVLGAVGMIAGLAVLVWAASGGLAPVTRMVWVAAAIFVYGAGQGLVLAPLNASVLARVPANLAGTGAGLVTTMMQVGNALGVALIGLVFFGVTGDSLSPATIVSRFDRSQFVLIALLLAFVVLMVVLQVSRRRDAARRSDAVAATDPGRPALSGRVSSNEGAPVPGATLTVVDSGGRQIGITLSDDSGAYTVSLPEDAEPHLLICGSPLHAPRAQAVGGESSASRRIDVIVRAASRADATVRTSETV